jgi:outer membrane protein
MKVRLASGAVLILRLLLPGVAPCQDTSSVRLVDLARRALATHPVPLAAASGAEAAAAQVGQVAADRWPSLLARSTVTQFQEPMLARPIHRFDPGSVELDETLMQGALELGYTVFDGGIRGAAIDRVRAAARGAQADHRRAESWLLAQVSGAYLNVLAAGAVLDALDHQRAALTAEVGRAQQLFAEGAAAEVAVLRARAALAEAEAERRATQATLETAEQELARLTGMAASAVRRDRLVPIRQAGDAQIPERAALVAAYEAASPELERAVEAVAAAQSERAAARAAWFPKVDIAAGYLAYGSGTGRFTAEWQGGIRVSYPVFVGGRRTSATGAADARATAARHELQAERLHGTATIDRALATLAQANGRVEALDAAVRYLTEIARIERLALDVGGGTQSDYLKAEADLMRTRARLIEAEHAALLSHVELARVTGALSLEWLERHLEHSP